MSIECFEVSFDRELPFLLSELDQFLRDSSLLGLTAYHDRIGAVMTLA
jgi:hypothetical protein